MPEKFDIVIAGSGFAGSIAALALHNCGFKVCIIEKESHPRFTIGESSTPVADMILRSLSDRYSLPFLRHLSRHGSWQQHYPELLCGIKRGFSYYSHTAGQTFKTDERHSHELFVAASNNDQNSDTNWYRPDFDAFLVKKVKGAGITYYDKTTICKVNSSGNSNIELEAVEKGTNHSRLFQCELLIDATGSPHLASALFDINSTNKDFETDSYAFYSHFDDVEKWSDYIIKEGYSTEDYPYDPDHSALHHLIEEGWMWNLRFNNGLLSAGFVIDRTHRHAARLTDDIDSSWRYLLSRYPSINTCFKNSRLSKIPGVVKQTGRMQRKMSRIYGKNWIALPHTAGFIDPLHSTGIAHTLSGLERLLEIINESWDKQKEKMEKFSSYQDVFFSELELIDLLVAGCYKSRMHFELFHAFTMLYFSCTLSYEQDRLKNIRPDYFLQAGDENIQLLVKQSYDDLNRLLKKRSPCHLQERFINSIRERIEPYNIAGLLDRGKQNMYHHTAVTLD